jgi:taspase (threonine aspartase 1)
MTKAFVAVHVGAGRHCRSTEPALKQLCAITCTTTMKSLQKGQTAIDAAEIAVKLLENHPGTNAGIGSSLNWDGKVECDAAMMDGCSGRFACIGAVPSIRHEQIVETYAIDVKNPVSLARRVLDDQNRHGRLVNPMYAFLEIQFIHTVE